MTLRSFAELAAKLAVANESMKVAAEVSLAETAALIADVAKDAIGTYEFGWQPLAAATVARKGADTPLLETGRLRDSIGWTMEGPKSLMLGQTIPMQNFMNTERQGFRRGHFCSARCWPARNISSRFSGGTSSAR